MFKKLNLRLIAGLLIVFALIVAFKGIVFTESTGNLFRDITRYFLYFTMLSNISAAIFFIGKGLNKKGFFFTSTNVRFTLLTAMVITSTVYFVMLFKIEPTLLDNIANFILHCFSTIFLLADYVTDPNKGKLTMGSPFKWASIFAFYIPYVLIVAKQIKWYPYPFIDLLLISPVTVTINIIAVVSAFILTGYFLLVLDRYVKKIRLAK